MRCHRGPTRPWHAAPHQRVGGPRAGANSRGERSMPNASSSRRTRQGQPRKGRTASTPGVEHPRLRTTPRAVLAVAGFQHRRRATAATARGLPRKGTARRYRAACWRVCADALASGGTIHQTQYSATISARHDEPGLLPAPGQPEPQRDGQGEHPLSDRDAGQDALLPPQRVLGHPTASAAGA
jgi:hypothetical protein